MSIHSNSDDEYHHGMEDEYISDFNNREYASALSDSDDDDDQPEVASNHSVSTASTGKKKRRKANDKYKEIIPGYILLYKGRRRKDRIEGFYTSNIPSANIRNAMTGYYENDFRQDSKLKVGSIYEDLFFKVSVAAPDRKETVTLFYDNPRQCETHLRTQFRDDIIQKWIIKHDAMVKQIQTEDDRENVPQFVEVR